MRRRKPSLAAEVGIGRLAMAMRTWLRNAASQAVSLGKGATAAIGIADIRAGFKAYEREDYPLAIKHLGRAAPHFPVYARVWYLLAVSQTRVGDHKAALENYRQALASNIPNSSIELGIAYGQIELDD